MGLEYFQQACPAVSTLQDAQVWCVAKTGICCGICPNTLTSLGTRVGLTFTVFFATLVTVVDGAEAPFIFMTTCLQAVAYLATVLEAGLTGEGISRFHAYYALFSSMGFLCPLAAASVTATHYHYGGAHQTGTRLLAFRTNTKRNLTTANSLGASRTRSAAASTYRSLGSPFFHSMRPLNTTDPFKHFEGTSTENSPMIAPEQGSPYEGETARRGRGSAARLNHPAAPRDEEAAIESPPLRATPSSLLGGFPTLPLDPHNSHHTPSPPPRPSEPSPRHLLDEPDSTITALPGLQLTSAAIPPTMTMRKRNRLQKRRRPEEPREVRPRSPASEYSPEQLRKIEKKVADGTWRRWGMIGANAALFLFWLVVFLFLHGILGSFGFVQTTCEDPTATELLTIASIALLCFSILVFVICALNFYSHVLHFHLRRVFDYSREPKFWTQLAVPAVFSGVVFALWLTLLWTSYELAAQPNSSLLAESEQSTTFATVLSLALVIKPVSDLIKAIFKHHRRRDRLAKSKLKGRPSAAPAGPPPSRLSSVRRSGANSEKREDFEKSGSDELGASEPLFPHESGSSPPRTDGRRDSHAPSSSPRASSTSSEFSRTSSQAERREPVSPESSGEEERRDHARRKRMSLRTAVVRRQHERKA